MPWVKFRWVKSDDTAEYPASRPPKPSLADVWCAASLWGWRAGGGRDSHTEIRKQSVLRLAYTNENLLLHNATIQLRHHTHSGWGRLGRAPRCKRAITELPVHTQDAIYSVIIL